MKTRDIFGLIVRLLGLVFVYNGLVNVPLAVSTLTSRFSTGIYTTFMTVLWPLAIAYWMLRGAPPISRIAYPPEQENSER